MGRGLHIVLVDGDFRRRAGISHRLLTDGLHVEPFESAAELIDDWPDSGIVVALDDGDAIRQLMDHMGSAGQWLPLVAFCESPAPRRIVEAVQNGAVDYLAWPFDDAEWAACLERVEAESSHLGSAKLREAMARSRVERLSGREREVLSAVASGLSNQVIANQLGISCRTVESHRANMLSKIGANHISEAIRVAIEAALVR